MERLKAEWIPQAYASSMFAGAVRHFHFVLGHYYEANGVQFGLLRLDLTPRPAYVALSAVGRHLAGARPLGRCRPATNVEAYAFRAQPGGEERDVLVIWAEREVDWEQRGATTSVWGLPPELRQGRVFDYLGRSLGTEFPRPLSSAPVYVELPAGKADLLPLEKPAPLAAPRPGKPSPVVLQIEMPRSAEQKVEDLPWSEGYAYRTKVGETLEFTAYAYNFSKSQVMGRVVIETKPEGWALELEHSSFVTEPMDRHELRGTLRIPPGSEVRDSWIILKADCAAEEFPRVAFRVLATDATK
jgi:hypothetical protein